MTISYGLAKELEEAGFPQSGDFYSPKEGQPNAGNVFFRPFKEDTVNMILLPTLSELIRACGEKFDCLTKVGINYGNWQAMSLASLLANGSTPEEAVAKLWLALNTK